MGSTVVDTLLRSDEPSVRWKVRVAVLGEDPDTRSIRRLQEEIRRSARVRRLRAGHAAQKPGTYDKWRGAHWVLAALADLGYPPGDPDLFPLRDALLRCWLSAGYFRKQLPGGGWPAEASYCRGVGERRGGFDHVDWGRVDSRRMNEWVTADALAVLAAGRP